MPFPVVYGIPKYTSQEVLVALRRAIVASLTESMHTPPEWNRPFFVADLLGEPIEPADGSKTIYVRLDTAMFYGKSEDEVGDLARKATAGLAVVIWKAFSGQYKVEVFIGDLNKNWKSLINAHDQQTVD